MIDRNIEDAIHSSPWADREVAYEQNVVALEKAWHGRIDAFAAEAVRNISGEAEDVQLEATDKVASRLFKSERWRNVALADLSDIAYEAVARVLASN